MEKFEFKSVICTSVEQSKRLLELGLKKKTADMSYIPIVVNHKVEYRLDCSPPKSIDIPAWSLHRLMEIMYKGDMFGFVGLTTHDRNIDIIYEMVIANIEGLIRIDNFNQDYLEEKV